MLSSESPVNVELDGKEQSDSFGLQLDEATEDTNKQDSHDDDAHTAEEQIDEKEKDLQYLHETKCFEGFESISMSYIWTSQLTCSNVMSTKITVYPFEDNSTSGINRKKPSSSFLGGGGGKTTGASTVASSLLCRATSQTELSGNQETFHIYSQAFSSNRSKQKASTKKSIGNFKSNLDHQAQLPSFRRSLPALPVPVNRLNQELLNERDRFMKHLLKEREEKKILENWAATKVQALYRSYSVRRPRQKKAAITRRQRLNTLTNIRIDVS
jgi:hypothetical protein